MADEVDGRVFCGLPVRAACPWCGYAPELGRSRMGRSSLWLVECRNRDCPVMPVSVGPNPRAAVDGWNCAATRPRPMEGG